MDIFSILTMIGGLALFLYGMNAMGDGLAKMAGGKLEQILEKLTSKRIFAVILGAVGELQVYTLGELLPLAFGSRDVLSDQT